MEEGLHIALAAEPLFYVWGVPVTGALLLTWVAMAALVALGYFVGRRAALVPGRLQTAFEAIFEYILDYMAATLESAALARRYFPLIATIFLFIFAANMINFLPGVESIGVNEGGRLIPLLRPAGTDLNVTLALAMISFLVIEISGIAALGFLKYGRKFITLKSPVNFAVGVLELIGNLARLVSFSFRLFGNIFAGHVLIAVIVFFVPLVLPVPLMIFEVFVGFMQAAIFALLTLVFIKLSISEPAH
ncbi:hypothetical protein A2852_02605 [Candidatus Adlerbacteria bacterium RIFCSPHIGHO2_01_FULL_54_23]|uniref:ATP synthase subunit a n=3 Tax=Candidatus Adleribacteriota TaxID=1752736 RepID=A0A1F4Y102_9BACT|nr:MAG: ATP synthase subunit a [Candidatus Adlerbacteria bacterium GW2011_GWA1_54_10]KKW38009.1 MAG: ATP synthase subunit a [Candidatus Adlerbacteria bacterium GW2011_GWB1_54_7]OGC78615.1 MAG: hypothetical protein A2852_02605 [Candidatus Adlerbacteria bacterium RIFCSPHIGHO2_01_FULL_54_23]OGC87622.1 MAG: hypothetical protein A3B33_01800 [Candidatus Adlerbacteria bacterium RIFCSPLOWO2_01_FULL_54_16]